MFRHILIVLIAFSVQSSEVLAQCCSGAVSGPELVVNGDFSKGNLGFNTSYEYAPTPGLGRYGITDDAHSVHPVFWAHCKDHTTGSDSFLWVDLSGSSSVNIWTQKLNQINPNSYYLFSCWVNNLGEEGPGTLQFSVNGKLMGFPLKASETLCYWKKFCYLWYSGKSSSALITITNQSSGGSGNDCGIDDISFRKYEPFIYYKPSVHICKGDSFIFQNGKISHSSYTYFDTIKRFGKCDSISATVLVVHPNYDFKYFISLCAGETYKLPDGNNVSRSGEFHYHYQSYFGCDSLISVVIEAHAQLLHTYAQSNTTCYGYDDGSILLKALNGKPPYKYRISNIENSTGEFLKLKSKSYNYLIKDSNGCTADGIIEISQPDEIKIQLYQSDFTVDADAEVFLQLKTNYSLVKWHWKPNSFLSCDTCSDVISKPDSSIVYVISASVPILNHWCMADTSLKIRIKPLVYLPNAFTPNIDLLNDCFQMSASSVESIEELSIQIFDAWGQKVFEENNAEFSWDGTYGNKKVPQGVYVYSLIYKLKNKQKVVRQRGTLSILR